MAIDFNKIGRDGASQSKSEDDILKAARLAKGSDLTGDERLSVSQGFLTGSKNKNTSSNFTSNIGQAATSFSALASPQGGTFGSNEYVGLESYAKGINGIVNAFKNGGGVAALWDGVVKIENQALEVLRQERDLRNLLNKEMAITSTFGDDVRDSIMTSASFGQKLGFSIMDSAKAFMNLNNETGRFATFSDQILQRGFKTAGAFLPSLDELGKTFAEFEKIGIGFSDTLSDLNEIGKRSMEIGLNGKMTIADVRTNIEQINKYGFKNGTEGLANMSRLAKIFRMDMADAFTIAEKVLDPEGAVELASKLQVLGGAIGQFNDPFKLMYDATNNVEDLQKSLIGAASSLATFNEQEGRFGVFGANLRMAREMASITGVKVEDLTKGAIAAQEKIKGLQELSTSAIKNIDPKEKDFLLNISKMEGGEMKITIPPRLQEDFAKLGTPITNGMARLRDLNDTTFSKIIQYQKDFEQMNPEDIARGQYTTLQNISNDVAAITSYVRGRMVTGAGGALKGMGVEGGLKYAAKALDLGTSNLTEYAQSNKKFSDNVASAVQKGLNFLSAGLTKQAKDAFDKADLKLSEELRKKRNEDNKQSGRANAITNTSIIEDVVGPGAQRTNDSKVSKVKIEKEVTVNWGPMSTLNNHIARASLQDPNFSKSIIGEKSRYSYDNDETMFDISYT